MKTSALTLGPILVSTYCVDFEFPVCWRRVFIFITIFFLLTLSPYCVSLCFILLSIYSFLGCRQALNAVILSVIIKYANPGLVAFPSGFGFYAWFFLFSSAMSLLLRSKIVENDFFIPLTIFYATVICLSFWSSYPVISMLKATSFYFVVLSILSGSCSLDRNEFEIFFRDAFNIFVSVLLLSVPFYFMGNVGFLRNGTGFQGVLSHPQSFGTFWVPLCAWIFIRIFFVGNSRHTKKYLLLLCILFSCMFLSKARTSFVATGLAILLSFPIFGGPRGRRLGVSMKKGVALSFICLITLIVLLGLSEDLFNAALDFITKGHADVTVSEAFHRSRGRGVESHWMNFMKSPWVGNGFGVDASADFAFRIKYLMGIPISATSEKGIVYTAILEEVGVLGTAAFLFFLSFLLVKAMSLRVPFMVMLFSCLTVNVGEAVLFSVNGNGPIYWVFIGLSLASANYYASAQIKESLGCVCKLSDPNH